VKLSGVNLSRLYLELKKQRIVWLLCNCLNRGLKKEKAALLKSGQPFTNWFGKY